MKKYNVHLIFVLLFATSMFSSCWWLMQEHGEQKYIRFVNKSDTTIFVYEKWQMNKPENIDTLLQCGSLLGWPLEKNDTSLFAPMNNFWETDFNVIPFIQYFVFTKRPPYLSEGCNEDSILVHTQKYLLKRYQLTKEDLDRMNWTITYP